MVIYLYLNYEKPRIEYTYNFFKPFSTIYDRCCFDGEKGLNLQIFSYLIIENCVLNNPIIYLNVFEVQFSLNEKKTM